MTNNLIVKENIKIENLIYEIRGKQVMLDRDLAKLYQIETRTLNQKVRRNIKRFPISFCFQMTKEEFIDWKSQTVMSDSDKIGLRRPPFVFTEQGVAMLSTIINTETAISISVKIIEAFVIMKRYIKINNNQNNRISNIETKVIELDNSVKLLKESFDKLTTKEEVNHIFYDGEIYDAYSLLIDILSSSKEEIIIIDNYAGKKLFDIIRNIMVSIKVYTSNIDTISKDKYEKQYSNLEIINTNIFHDRFILIDRKTLYHSGVSFKDLGKKCFAITKIEDITIINNLLDRLEGLNE